MKNEKASGPGYRNIHNRMEDVVAELESAFLAGQPVPWPLVKQEDIHSLWDCMVRTGYTNEERLQGLYESMRDNLVRLQVATIVAGHEGVAPESVLERCAEQVDAFCDWLLEGPDGWRISDYGIRPLSDALALAFEAKTQAAKVKYLDRALNVTHCRGDLSKLFIEGGRKTVLALPELVYLLERTSF